MQQRKDGNRGGVAFQASDAGGDCWISNNYWSKTIAGIYRKFLLGELQNRLAIQSWECSDTDFSSTDFGCLLLQVSYEDEATFWYQERFWPTLPLMTIRKSPKSARDNSLVRSYYRASTPFPIPSGLEVSRKNGRLLHSQSQVWAKQEGNRKS